MAMLAASIRPIRALMASPLTRGDQKQSPQGPPNMMTPRDTRTGGVLEAMILPALRRGHYECEEQVRIGQRIGGGTHKVDAVAEKDGARILVSLKWQQVGGTAEQKVPFEVICLSEAVRGGEYSKAYLVLGGEGWTLRNFYTSGGLKDHLKHADDVHISTLEGFVALANQGKL
jgi:hypothetical protein